MRAVDLFDEGVEVPCIARELRVSEKSVYRGAASGGRADARRCVPEAPAATAVGSARTCRPSS
ncbi:hypothetical protein [Streptomyces sp. NPDC056061]|uniref:hypothetical protein n=1 Tax=Streptomyces sp. NPDC056061 TaxID=3345700 RepID=UPI0035D5DC6B